MGLFSNLLSDGRIVRVLPRGTDGRHGHPGVEEFGRRRLRHRRKLVAAAPEHSPERSDTVVFELGGQYPVNATGARAGRMIVRNGIVDLLGDARLCDLLVEPSLLVGNNGILNVVAGTFQTVNSALGESSLGRGELSVLNEGTRWENDGRLLVGDGGPGKLSVVNGFASALETRIGGGPLAAGEVVVGGNTARFNTGSVAVGFGGPGLLDIRDGAAVFSEAAAVGRAPEGEHEVLVGGFGAAGQQATWRVLQDLTLGGGGPGALRLSDGGFVLVERGLLLGSGATLTLRDDALFSAENIGAAPRADGDSGGAVTH